jgi:hypothetical protein
VLFHVNEHRARHSSDGSNGALSDSILVVCASARERDSLSAASELFSKLAGGKRAIIGMEGFDAYAGLKAVLFVGSLRCKGVRRAQRDLVEAFDVARSVIS